MTSEDPYRERRLNLEERAMPLTGGKPGHTWVPARKLGEGTFGRAYLWSLVNDLDRKVVDSVVLKYTEVRSEQIITHSGPGEGHIREIFMQRVLTEMVDDPKQIYTVPLLAAEHCSWSIDAWRLYTPYYAFGDLYDFIEKQGKEDYMTMKTGHRQMPEPFIWYLLHRLACAAVIMDITLRTKQADGTYTDHQMVHVDLKPENIFLGPPGTLGKHTAFAAYPVAYVGDFGNAIITYEGALHDHLAWGNCTRGWSPPELTPYDDGPQTWQAAPTSRSNVWQIGYIIMSALQGMVQHEEDPDWPQVGAAWAPRYAPLPRRTPAREAINKLRREYSSDLLDVLNACVNFRVQDRPTPVQLVDAIERCMVDHTEGMEDWGTERWFNKLAAQNPGPGDTLQDHETEDFPSTAMTSLISGVKNLFGNNRYVGLVSDPPQRYKKRQVSPFHGNRRREARHKRGKDYVQQQIKAGYRPNGNRPLPKDPADEVFTLHDDLKLINPGPESTIGEWLYEQEPRVARSRVDIDDLRRYRRGLEKWEEEGDGYPPVGRKSYNFRFDGEPVGETLADVTVRRS
ncbi:kinase-like protein [Aureobasidium subglaciale]|nr:kinase-like protein [Aureobasidium subglaciale]